MQCCLHIQEASEISDFSLKFVMHIGHKLVKWLDQDIQIVLLALALPRS